MLLVPEKLLHHNINFSNQAAMTFVGSGAMLILSIGAGKDPGMYEVFCHPSIDANEIPDLLRQVAEVVSASLISQNNTHA